MKENNVRYLSECPSYAPGVKRWHMLLGIFAFVVLMGIIYFFSINTRPSKEQIAQHKALIKREIDKVTTFIELDAGLRNEEARIIANLILDYYWELHEINPKHFTCSIVRFLGHRRLDILSGDEEPDQLLKELNQELERSGIPPRRERLTFRVDFILNENSETDVFNVYLPSYEIERVNTR